MPGPRLMPAPAFAAPVRCPPPQGLASGEGGYWPGQQGPPAGSPTLQSVLPQHVGSWELQSQVVTQQAFEQAQQAAAAAAAAAASASAAAEEEEGWRPDVVAMMERKGATGGCRQGRLQ